jgi:deazaflavin-dependent oxidoreductase (nitroreductase family)
MTETQQAKKHVKGTPGRLSRWIQVRANVRTNKKVRGGKGTFMGMDLLILHTVGRRSGQLRESPVAWFEDGDSKLVVASGGGTLHPAWYVNLMAHPDRASIELPGTETAVPVTPHRLEGAEREAAWKFITAAQPRLAKYQSKSERQYPVVRLTPR